MGPDSKYSPDSLNRRVIADAASSGALLVVHSPRSADLDVVPTPPGGTGFGSPPEHPRSQMPARTMMRDLDGNIGSLRWSWPSRSRRTRTNAKPEAGPDLGEPESAPNGHLYPPSKGSPDPPPRGAR